MILFVIKEKETGKYIHYSEYGCSIELVSDISKATFLKKEVAEVLVIGEQNYKIVEIEIRELNKGDEKI